MNVTRLFKNVFGRNKNHNRSYQHRPSWKKLPPLQLPPLRLRRKLRKLRLPELPPLQFPRIRARLPHVQPPSIKLPKVRNPFKVISIKDSDEQGIFILLSWLGYVILIVSAIDYLRVLYPPQLTNPSWEFQTFINLVNNTWLVLLALILIFMPNRSQIRRFELVFLRFLRWIILLGSVIFILLIPLTIQNANRLNQQATVQLGQQQTTQQKQLNNLEDALQNESVSYFQMQRLKNEFNIQETPESVSLEDSLIEKVQQRKQELQQQIAIQKRNRFRELFAQAGRNIIAGLLIGIFLIRLWWEARWIKFIRG
jgi:uncharacterized membrane protein